MRNKDMLFILKVNNSLREETNTVVQVIADDLEKAKLEALRLLAMHCGRDDIHCQAVVHPVQYKSQCPLQEYISEE